MRSSNARERMGNNRTYVAYERAFPITIPLPILEKTIQSSGFRATVKLASHFELIGGSLVAGDSTKLRAQNSRK
jgi:hypothetical protein